MSYLDKVHQKIKIQKMIEQAMNTPEYKKAKQEDMKQATLRAMARFTFIGCVYLEMNFRCKKKGLEKWIDFMRDTIEEIGNDENYIRASNEYYKGKMNLDVMKRLGLGFEEDEND